VKNTCKIAISKPEGKGPLGRPTHRQNDNIEVELRVIGYEGMNWIELTQGRDK
jgi:hypothetical protein